MNPIDLAQKNYRAKQSVPIQPDPQPVETDLKGAEIPKGVKDALAFIGAFSVLILIQAFVFNLCDLLAGK